MTKITKSDFEDRLERCFNPENAPKLFDNSNDDYNSTAEQEDYGLTAEQETVDLDDWIREINSLAPAKPLNIVWTEDDLKDVEIIQVARHKTRYDLVFNERCELDDLLLGLDPNSDEYGVAMSRLADVKRRMAIEIKRSTDDIYRKYEQVNKWRATEGKDDYNTSRRVSDQPNQMTPKEVLATERPEQKQERLRLRNNQLARQRHAKGKAS
jgi:hypothetical protein